MNNKLNALVFVTNKYLIANSTISLMYFLKIINTLTKDQGPWLNLASNTELEAKLSTDSNLIAATKLKPYGGERAYYEIKDESLIDSGHIQFLESIVDKYNLYSFNKLLFVHSDLTDTKGA